MKKRSATKREVEFGPLAEKVDAYCEEHDKTFASVVREAVAKKIGAKDETKQGRPRKTEAG